MTGVFPCTVCDTDFESSDALATYIVPIFSRNDKTGAEEEVKGWNCRIRQCSPCKETLGEPLKTLQRPYRLNLAIFANSDKPIVLKGSYPRD